MKLVIQDKYKYSNQFYFWLLTRLKAELLQSASTTKLRNVFRNLHDEFNLPVDERHAVPVFLTIVNSLRIRITRKSVFIEIDSARRVKGTTLKYAELAKLIDFGCLSVKGYPIFTKVFNLVSDKISKYYIIYLHEGGLYVSRFI